MAIILPPLAGFKAFEASARHQSFTKAARELNITQAAVSQQIKQLEYHLGFELFTRYPRKLVLTVRGASLAETVRHNLTNLSEKIMMLQSGMNENSLVINTMQSFAMKWLIPRLSDFNEQHPDIDIRLNTEERLVDLAAEGVDLVFRSSRGPDPMLYCQLLREEFHVAVYSPKIIKGKKAITKETLHEYPLLHWGDLSYWQAWIDACCLNWEDYNFGSTHSHLGNMVQGAVAGQGVALVPYSLASHDVEMANLFVIDSPKVPAPANYYIMCLPETAERPVVADFNRWVNHQIRKSSVYLEAAKFGPQSNNAE